MEKQEIAIVFLCAGISSRFGGNLKQFAQVGPNGEILIEYSLNQALKSGFTKIIFIVGNKTEIPFREKFGNSYKGVPITYALQKYDEKERDKPWGTAEALVSVKPFLNCPFVICNGDDIYGEKIFKILADHLKNSSECALVGFKLIKVIPDVGTTNRGIISIKNGYLDEIHEVLGIDKNNLKATNTSENDLCSLNMFAFQMEALDFFEKKVEEFKQTHKGDRKSECYLPTETNNLIREGKIKMKVYPTEERWTGITNPGDEEVVREELKKS